MNNSFNIDKRSVYFKSLVNHPEYNEILNEGYYILNSQTIDLSNNKNNFGMKYKTALTILKKGIETERQVELKYLENLKHKIP